MYAKCGKGIFMVTLKVVVIGAIISYAIAGLMKLTMVCIKAFNKGGDK